MPQVKKYIIALIVLLPFLSLNAAKSTVNDTLRIGVENATQGGVSGSVTNFEGAPLGGVIVRAVHLPDSLVVGGMATDTLGAFNISSLPFGDYIFLCTAVGYSKGFTRVSVTEEKPFVTAKPIRIDLTDHALGEAVVVGHAPLVTVTDDTVAYNASAMTTTEGAMAEELIEQIPGAEITEDGKIKINGKEYSKILIDGKEFFGDDISATLQNLPANIVRRIKTYDRRSDRARLTGIDDGEEHNVIDIEIKKDMFKGLVGNVGLSAGNYDRYNERLNVNRFRSNQHAALVVNMNNINNPAFSERGNGASNASRQSRTGYTASKSIGVTYAKDKRKKYKVSGNVRYSFSDAENQSERNSITTYSNLSEHYGHNDSRTDRKRNELNADFEWEWHPDTLTTIHLRPNFSYNSTDNLSSSRGRGSSWTGDPEADTVQINSHNSLNNNESNGVSTGSSVNIFRRLSPKGRNVSFSGSFNYNDNNSTSWVRNISNYMRANRQGLNKNYDRYNDGGTYNSRYSLGFNYTEPVFNKSYLSFRYNYTNSHSHTDRMGYQYDHQEGDTIYEISDIAWEDSIPIDTTLSNITANTYQSHTFHLSMRHVTDKLNLNYGVNLNPRHNEADFILGQKMDRGLVKQDLLNWSPSLHMKYKFTKRNSLEINYTGNSSEPNVEQLQELIDKTNPQSIRYGNPGLKPAFTHSVRASFNSYGEKKHRSLVTNWNYSNTSNNTSTMTFTESSTGFRISKLMNVSGQWNTNGNINFNMPLDSLQRWNLSTTTWASYNENTNFNSTPLSDKLIKSVGISSLENISFDQIDLLKEYARINNTHSFRINQGFGIRFHNQVFSWRIGGNIVYYKVSNTVKNGLKRETFDYSANANFQVELPFNMQFSTNASFVSRHGYSSSIQKNVCIWNAQLTKRLFNRNAGSISFQIFDILHQRTNISRSINTISISDTKQLMLRNYFLLSFQYNFNTLRNRARQMSGRNHQNGNRNNNGQMNRNNGNRQGQNNSSRVGGLNRNGGSFGGGGNRGRM